MTERLDLDAIDRDGAVRQAEARIDVWGPASGGSYTFEPGAKGSPPSPPLRGRRELLGGALAGVGALLAVPSVASAALSKRDRSVLEYALSLEQLQDAFYTEAVRLGALSGRVAAAASELGRVERAHVRAFRDLLGSRAPSAPRFDFRGTTEDELAFLRTAVALEELCVGAYAGQASRIRSPEVLQAAMGIHSVEARHAAWLRRLLDVRPTVASFDVPRARRSVVGTISAKGFVVDSSDAPTTHRRTSTPRFTG